ncbi:MAG: tetratricopeptide repeat protein [Chitinispirillaceae bacterium]
MKSKLIHMNRKQNRRSFFSGAWLMLLLLFPFAVHSNQTDEWRARENQVLRFGSQWKKIADLNQELNQISDVIADIRDIQLFPAGLTRLDNPTVVSIDRKIEKIEKRCLSVKAELSALRVPFTDAMTVLREMVVKEPVEGMFEVLEHKDLERINEMIEIKNEIDSLWRSIDELLLKVSAAMEIGFVQEEKSSDKEEFVQILKASLGQQAESSYRKLNAIKNSLMDRSSLAQARDMYRVEYRRVQKYLSKNKYELARKKTLNLVTRYEGRVGLDELNLELARVNFSLGHYSRVLPAAQRITKNTNQHHKSLLYVLQSLYALKEFEKVWSIGNRTDLDVHRGKHRNMIIWIIMESGIALKEKDNYSRLASRVVKGESYHFHVLHSLARSYLLSRDTSMAVSVLESASKMRPGSKIDRTASHTIKITLAELLYERGEFESALSLYFPLLKEEKDLDQVLTGIAWCYFGMGADGKAENALRKLINQKPESFLAAEAIYVMAKRFLHNAKIDWEKNVFLVSEEHRLTKLLDKVEKRIAESENPEKRIVQAATELQELITRLKKESRADYNQIISSYNRVYSIHDLVEKHYSSGSFQKVTFTEKREELLYVLDSLLIAVQKQDKNSVSKKLKIAQVNRSRAKIKSVVNKLKILRTVALLDQYRWEREYLDWQKKQFRLKESDSISAQLDSILEKEEVLRKYAYSELAAGIRKVISLGISSRDEAYLRYHLAELYYSEENDRFSEQYDQYEANFQIHNELISAQDNRKKQVKAPVAPVLVHDKSLAEYRRAVASDGDSSVTAAAFYSMGWCFNDLAQFDSAYHYMEKVAENYPLSPHAAQAWMYCGENRFEKADLEEAIRCYRAVMRYPESEYFDQALYKLAWTQYRLSNPHKAISSFLALVELGEGNKAGALLEKESMDYIAISFSETDISGELGLKKAVAFVNKFGDDQRAYSILKRLAGVYSDQGRYDMAKKSYRKLLTMYPEHPENFEVESRLLALREKGASPDETGLLKMDFYKKYSIKGFWAETQKDSSVLRKSDSAAAHHLYEAAIGFHQFALQNKDAELFDFALDAYGEYINSYPEFPLAGECHYNLAEIHFSRGRFRRAAEEYMKVSQKYDKSKYRETAAWNAIVASQQLLKQEEEKNNDDL